MGARLTNKQRADFADMLRPHHQYLARFCQHLSDSGEDGRDLYQQAILKALVKLDTLKETGRFRQWICTIIVNEHRNHCRKERLRRLFRLSAQQEKINHGLTRTGSQSDPDDVGQTIRLRQCLARLSAKKREALLMFEVEGFPLAEIAEIQHCSLTAVKTRVSRARRELRKLFVGGNPSPAARHFNREDDHAFKVGLETME